MTNLAPALDNNPHYRRKCRHIDLLSERCRLDGELCPHRLVTEKTPEEACGQWALREPAQQYQGLA